MPSRSRHRRPRSAASAREAADHAGAMAAPAATLAGAASTPPTLSARAATEAAHGAFQDAVRDLGHPDETATRAGRNGPSAADATGRAPAVTPAVTLYRWTDEGGPRRTPSRGGHRPRPVAGAAWEARKSAHDRVHVAAGAYARALRREGVGLPAALAAVHAVVAGSAARLPAAPHAAVQRDATRCCLEAFYAH